MTSKVNKTVQTSDGINLFYREYLPKKKTNSFVLFIHGWGDHSGTTNEFQEFLCSHGVGVYALDLRGHGRSDGQRGYITSWNDYSLDVFCVYNQIIKNNPNIQIHLSGLSMGGLVATSFIQQKNNLTHIKSLTLIAPMLALSVKIDSIKQFIGNLMSFVLPKFSLSTTLNLSHITLDTYIQEIRKNDSLQHSMANSRWFTEGVQAQKDVISNIDLIKIPTMVCHSDNDMVNSYEASRDFYDKLTLKEKKIKKYQNKEHGLLYSTIKEEVFHDILLFIKSIS